MVVQRADHYGSSVGLERDLRIQVGVLSRVYKEHAFYKAEAEKLGSKVCEMKRQAACIHDIRHMEEVHVESLSMIPQVERQILVARQKLQEIVNKFDEQEGQTDSIRQLLLDSVRLIKETGELGTEETKGSSTASASADEDPPNVCEYSDDEY